MTGKTPKDLLLGSFHAALAAADPLKIVPQHLPKPPKGRTLVVGAGKAAAAMALAVEQQWPADAPLDGTVITRYAHGLLTNRIKVIEAKPDDTYAALAHKTSLKDHPEETLRLLNGDHPHGEPRAGNPIKIVQ